MAVYQIKHITSYTYEEPVSICHNVAYLLPRVAPRHFWFSAEVDVYPKPLVTHERRDFFGNRPLYFAIQEPHHELHVTATGQVEVLPREDYDATDTLAWELGREWLQREARRDEPDVYQFLFASPYISLPKGIAEYAEKSFEADRPLLESVLDISRRIHRDIKYDPDATTITTTVQEVLQHRRGVCQDLAHLMVACLRTTGLAARYVSGYLLTSPPPGKPRLVGADASHAWVSVFVPGLGWVDVDPTNDLMPSDKHITIAWGRDFGDVSPLRGVILGGASHSVAVSVDVAPVEAEVLAKDV